MDIQPQCGGAPKSLKKSAKEPLRGVRSSMRVAEKDLMESLARIGLGDAPVTRATYVPTLPRTQKSQNPLDNLDKKSAKQLHELLVSLRRKLSFMKNPEIAQKIAQDMQRVAEVFMARHKQECDQLHARKKDVQKIMGRSSTPALTVAPLSASPKKSPSGSMQVDASDELTKYLNSMRL